MKIKMNSRRKNWPKRKGNNKNWKGS